MLEKGFYHADCMEHLKDFPDKHFGLALLDPPFGIKADKGTNGFGTSAVRKYKGGWDNEPPPKEYFDEVKRISKNQIIWGGQYMIDYLEAGNKWIVWDKVGEIEFKNPFSKCELAWTSFNGTVDKFLCKQMGFISEDKSERIHPTQKPVALYKWLLEKFAKEGDLILDTHVGSASSLVACEELGFDYVGFEIDETYYKRASERLAKSRSQVNIFELLE